MTFEELAIHMLPMWGLGIFMLMALFVSGHRDLLRVDLKALRTWVLFLVGLSIYRAILFSTPYGKEMLKHTLEATSWLPWQGTLFVFWEDLAHTVPLVLLRRWLGTRWFTWPVHAVALILIMVEFGSGHLYQGILPAVMLSFYIPYTMSLGQKKGFGTIMIGHILYDLSTVLMIQYMARFL